MKNWIDRYLYAVGQRLPKAQREDIKKELKSLILDDLDEKVANMRLKRGEEYKETEDDVLSILESFGSPAEVAAKYRPDNRYFIGPELYELYRLLLFIVLGATAFGISIATVVSVFSTQGSFLQLLYKLPMQLISAGISSVGSVTIVFALIQYFANEDEIRDINFNKKWNPKDLEPVPVSYEVIKLSDAITAICFTILALIVFNMFPHIIALYVRTGGDVTATPIFSLNILSKYMAYLNIFWVGAIFLNVWKLKSGKWTIPLRLAQVVVDVGVLVVILMMASNPMILNPAIYEVIISTNLLIFLNAVSFKIFAAIIILTTAFEVIKHIYYCIKK